MTFHMPDSYYEPPEVRECECEDDDCTCEQDAIDGAEDAAIDREQARREDREFEMRDEVDW